MQKPSKKIIIVGLVFLLVIISVIAYQKQLDLNFIKNNYVEECLAYEQISYNKTLYYCDSNFRYLMFCYGGKYLQQSYNKFDIDCNCPDIANRTKINYRNGQCIKYHLVRNVK